LPEERAWLDEIFEKGYLTDGFRLVNQENDQYTWWSYRARAWDSNAGWRIDYQMITADLAEQVKEAFVYKDTRFSDHAPLVMRYDKTL